jgi:hypothetical protein
MRLCRFSVSVSNIAFLYHCGLMRAARAARSPDRQVAGVGRTDSLGRRARERKKAGGVHSRGERRRTRPSEAARQQPEAACPDRAVITRLTPRSFVARSLGRREVHRERQIARTKRRNFSNSSVLLGKR